MSTSVVQFSSTAGNGPDAAFHGMRVLAVIRSPELREHLSRTAAGLDGIEIEFASGGGSPMHELDRCIKAPHAIMIEGGDPERVKRDLRELRSRMEGARIYVCVLSSDRSEDTAVFLLKEGADDIISVTPTAAEISTSLVRASASRGTTSPSDDHSGMRTIAFIHASGGSGATTLAVNSAIYLQSLLKEADAAVSLLDMDLQFGMVDVQLDLSHRSKVIDLVKMPERLDSLMLQDLMVEGPGGMRVLTAPDILLPVDVLDYGTVDTIMSIARRRFRFVVVDLPHALTTWTDCVLRRADRIFLVTQMNVLALRATRRLLDTLVSEGIDTSPVRVVANRYPARGAGKRVSVSQATDALGVPVTAQIPNDYRLIAESLDQGIPAYLLRPKSKVSRAVAEMLREFADDYAASPLGGVAGSARLRS